MKLCPDCGYVLTSKVSGTCPECGAATEARGVGRVPEPMRKQIINLAADDPRNTGVIRCQLARLGRDGVPAIAGPDSAGSTPYMSLGSHPDIVERVWELGAALPVDCRCVFYGTPALVTPVSGIVLAAAWGTAYLLRLPQEAVPLAIREGATTVMKWAGGSRTDVSKEIGPDWVFGRWLKQEPQWCLDSFSSAERHTF